MSCMLAKNHVRGMNDTGQEWPWSHMTPGKAAQLNISLFKVDCVGNQFLLEIEVFWYFSLP